VQRGLEELQEVNRIKFDSLKLAAKHHLDSGGSDRRRYRSGF
jgi:hypothetical protein